MVVGVWVVSCCFLVGLEGGKEREIEEKGEREGSGLERGRMREREKRERF